MVLVEQDAVVVLPTRVTTTARMLAVLAHTTVAGTDVPALLPVLPQPCKKESSKKNLASAVCVLDQGPCHPERVS